MHYHTQVGLNTNSVLIHEHPDPSPKANLSPKSEERAIRAMVLPALSHLAVTELKRLSDPREVKLSEVKLSDLSVMKRVLKIRKILRGNQDCFTTGNMARKEAVAAATIRLYINIQVWNFCSPSITGPRDDEACHGQLTLQLRRCTHISTSVVTVTCFARTEVRTLVSDKCRRVE